MPAPNFVVVLMFENRSFDHMLGFLPEVGDLTGDETNPVDPKDPASEQVPVSRSDGSDALLAVSPGHQFLDTQLQLFGGADEIEPAPLDGFVASALAQPGLAPNLARKVMVCQTPRTVPVLSRLASEYCACTRWFSSVPGPTWPNRFFVHAATSAGLLTDTQLEEGVETIQTTLQAKTTGKTWRVYAGDVPQCLAIGSMLGQWVHDRESLGSYQHFQGLTRFFADLKAGTLPNYAFLEPHYFDMTLFGLPLWRASDEHPPHSLAEGEKLLQAVAGSLAASTYWNDSLLLVLYDEHGGFYDKVSPPIGVKAPDAKVSLVPPFDFTRLGLRVPAVLVSPYVGRGVIDATVYDHASVPATLNKLFGLGPDNFLTQRDRFANTFETNLTGVTPRPASELSWATPEVGFVGDALAYLNADLRPVFDVVVTQLGGRADGLSEHQQALVDLSRTALARLP